MIVIPMAGRSQRFREAGYTLPKFMLPLAGETVFDAAVRSFTSVFSADRFIFVSLEEAVEFVEAKAAALGIRYVIVPLKEITGGQAETVALGIDRAGVLDGEPIRIFNIDTFRPGYVPPASELEWDGHLEVFVGEGEAWSFVLPADNNSNRVAATTEKKRISNLCCTGLYHFKRAGDFRSALSDQRNAVGLPSELYVAPLYNFLIARGFDIRYVEIGSGNVVFCGVPEEYEALRAG